MCLPGVCLCRCWAADPKGRPSTDLLVDVLGFMLQQHQQQAADPTLPLQLHPQLAQRAAFAAASPPAAAAVTASAAAAFSGQADSAPAAAADVRLGVDQG